MKQESLTQRCGRFADACGSLRVEAALEDQEEKEIVFTIGAAERGKYHYLDLAKELTNVKAANEAFAGVEELWNEILTPEQIKTPDEALNLMTNIWLKYQAVSCRLWGKSAYYQVSAGYGFRDQLQDSLVFLVNKPELARKQILLHATQQFREGDVLHWWFTINGGGPRTKCSDDLLWLPYILDAYLTETKDYAILDEVTPYLDGGEDTLYGHCKASIERCFYRFSPRGIPLMGDHDWNDGLSAIGNNMKGESFWVAEFLYSVLKSLFLLR
jgi:cellobiose phosphorylase